jgi:hypothetical protein
VPVPVVLAHQANWDEILLVCVPLAAFWGLLRLGRRRGDDIAAGKVDAAEFGIDESSFGDKTPRISEKIGRGPSSDEPPAAQ